MKRCGVCGSKSIALKNAKGRQFQFEDHLQLPLAFDYFVNTCNHCGNQVLSNKNVWELNELLKQSVSEAASEAISHLTEQGKLRQTDIALAIGQTPQYISNLKNKIKAPSFATLSLLRIYAKYPDVFQEMTGLKSHALEIAEIDPSAVRRDENLGWSQPATFVLNLATGFESASLRFKSTEEFSALTVKPTSSQYANVRLN